MAVTTGIPASNDDVVILRLAREIAMDIHPLEDILKRHDVTEAAWEEIQQSHRFKDYLRGAITEWHSATNTAERVKLKSLAFVEEALPEFYARAHDAKEPLSAKIEVLKTVAKFAGVGGQVEGAVSGEKLTVTINLGADNQLRIERDVTPQVIEGEAE
jgi:hypothetical protein